MLHSQAEHAALTATKWSVFSALLLLSGLPGLVAALGGRGRTPVYESGIVGPHGFVPWTAAESIELVTTPDSRQELCVGAYHGWNLRIAVPPEQAEQVRNLVTRHSDRRDDQSMESAC